MLDDTFAKIFILLTEGSILDEISEAIEAHRSNLEVADQVQKEVNEFFRAIREYDSLPKVLEPLFDKLLSDSLLLAPCTAKDLANAATQAFAGTETFLPEHLRNGITRLMGCVIRELRPPWDRDHAEWDEFEEEGKSILDHSYQTAESREEGLAPQELCDSAFCGLELMAPPILLTRYGWPQELCGVTNWHESVASDPKYADAIESFSKPKDACYQQPYWRGPWNTSLYLLPWPIQDMEDMEDGGRGGRAGTRLFFCPVLDGAFSDDALANAMGTLTPFVEPIFAVILDAATKGERILYKHGDATSAEQQLNDAVADFLAREQGKARTHKKEWFDDSSAQMRAKPSCFYIFSDDIRAMFGRCLDICLMPEGERKGIAKQVFTSLMLITEARKVPHDGVAVALAFAAIESLLTDKNDRLIDILRNYCAILLQPDPERRTKKQRSRIEKLYDLRSEVMHGRGLTGSPKERAATLRLAAGVLRAVCAYDLHCQRMGQELTKKDLRYELYTCEEKQQSPIGATDLSDLLPPDFK